MEKGRKTDQTRAQSAKKPYAKPTLKKHENLKEITLLSFTPPTN